MNVRPGIVQGECEPGVNRNELLTLFHQATRETQELVLKYLRLCESNTELSEMLRALVLKGEIAKVMEIIKAINI